MQARTQPTRDSLLGTGHEALARGGAPALNVVAAISDGALGARQTQSVWDRIYTDEQADRGEALYRATCEGCHAPDLSGGKVVPELIGATFTDDWTGLTVGQLFERILLSMPEADPASVSRSEKADIVAFILRANGFPAGQRDLEPETDILDRFRFGPR